jgi:hypothetical protein
MCGGGPARPAPRQLDDTGGPWVAIRFLPAVLHPCVKGREESQTNQCTDEVQQALERGCPPLVSHTQAPAAEQPRECALHHPAAPPETLRGVDPATGEARRDASGA